MYLVSVNKNIYLTLYVYRKLFFFNEKDHPDITGFILANFSTRNIKRGGTAIYCKNHLNYTVRNIDTLLEVSAIDIKLNNKLTTIVNIYMIQIVKLHKVNTKKYSLKLVTNMSFVEILMPTINYGGVDEMIQRATICITMLLKII